MLPHLPLGSRRIIFVFFNEPAKSRSLASSLENVILSCISGLRLKLKEVHDKVTYVFAGVSQPIRSISSKVSYVSASALCPITYGISINACYPVACIVCSACCPITSIIEGSRRPIASSIYKAYGFFADRTSHLAPSEVVAQNNTTDTYSAQAYNYC